MCTCDFCVTCNDKCKWLQAKCTDRVILIVNMIAVAMMLVCIAFRFVVFKDAGPAFFFYVLTFYLLLFIILFVLASLEDVLRFVATIVAKTRNGARFRGSTAKGEAVFINELPNVVLQGQLTSDNSLCRQNLGLTKSCCDGPTPGCGLRDPPRKCGQNSAQILFISIKRM